MVKKIFPLILSISLLISTIFASRQATMKSPPEVNTDSLDSENSNIDKSQEMKAIWIPFMSLQPKYGNCSEDAFKQNFDSIIKEVSQYGINTLIVHVRPFGDSLYPSSIYPWSHILTGTQGNDPGFDPLKYMVEATHQANMQFHAWVNPLRISLNNTPSILCENNPYNKWRNDENSENDDWVLDLNNDKYYNPAYPEVRKMIIDGIREIVEKYPIDAIHFDDYFYPKDNLEFDKQTYNNYLKTIDDKSKALSQNDWRILNINTLIHDTYKTIKDIDPNVEFGISPQANTKNDLKMGADIYTWGSQEGYVDYLCPQLYVNFEHPILPYDKAVDEWRELIKCNKIKFYIGLGIYKAGSDVDNGTWKNSNEIIMKQIEYGRSCQCNGFMLYSYDYLNTDQTSQEIQNAMKVFN